MAFMYLVNTYARKNIGYQVLHSGLIPKPIFSSVNKFFNFKRSNNKTDLFFIIKIYFLNQNHGS